MKKTVKKLTTLLLLALVFSFSMTNIFAENANEETNVSTSEPVNEVLDQPSEEVLEEEVIEDVEEVQDEEPTEEVQPEVSELVVEETEDTEEVQETDEANEATPTPVSNEEPVEADVVDAVEETNTNLPSISFRNVGDSSNAPTSPLVLQLYNKDKVLETRNFESETATIGQPQGWGESNWHIKTFRKIFLGWSPLENYTGAKDEPIYSYGESVKTIYENGHANGPLYPVFASQAELINLYSQLNGSIEINKVKTAKETLPNAEIKTSEGFSTHDVKKTATVYFNPETEKYEVSLDTNFQFENNKIAAIVAANPLGIIKSAEGVTDFGGAKPTNYTYVDLKVVLDENVDVATIFEEIQFTSGLFMARAILDESYNVLQTIDTLPTAEEKTVSFNFNNPNQLKTFIIRTTVRNYGQDGGGNNTYRTNNLASHYIFGDMILSSGKSTNITISKEKAEVIKDLEEDYEFKGSVNGYVASDKKNLDFITALFFPSGTDIPTIESGNTVNIKFATDDRPKPQVQPEKPAKVEVKWTCADEGKVWSEEKQVCVYSGYIVPNTATVESTSLYFGITLAAVIGLVALKLRKNKN